MRIARMLISFSVAGWILAAASFPFTRRPAAQAHADRKAEGAELFSTSGCTHCHGGALQGTEKGPVLLNVRKKLTAEQMHKQIAEGGTSMPAFGDSLSGDQIDALIEFLRNKHPEKLLAAQPKRNP